MRHCPCGSPVSLGYTYCGQCQVAKNRTKARERYQENKERLTAARWAKNERGTMSGVTPETFVSVWMDAVADGGMSYFMKATGMSYNAAFARAQHYRACGVDLPSMTTRTKKGRKRLDAAKLNAIIAARRSGGNPARSFRESENRETGRGLNPPAA